MNKTAGTILVMALGTVLMVLILLFSGGGTSPPGLAQAVWGNGGPDLAISKSDGGVTGVQAGNNITYTITVTNTGTVAASGVLITDTIPAGTTFLDLDTNPGWFCGVNDFDITDGSICIFPVGVLDNSSTITTSLVVAVNPQLPITITEIVNIAEVGDDGTHGPDIDPGDNSVSVPTPVLPTVVLVLVDTKPKGCPNPLNVKSKGVLPVAILGTADFDATQVDPATVQLAGVSPLRWALEDVAIPFEPFVGKADAFDCTKSGPDGFLDLTLKFKTQEIVAALGTVNDGDVLVLELMGNLFDGTPITGEDVIVIRKK